MQTKKFQGIVHLKNGQTLRPVIETNQITEARKILKAQYPDATAIHVTELR